MDLKDIKAIVDLMKKNSISEFELEKQDFKIKLKRATNGIATFQSTEEASMAPQPVPTGQIALPPNATAALPGVTELEVKSPMVGTFYRAPSPESANYIEVGSELNAETVVCIIEAMKVMNEIKAEVRGIVTQVLVDNAKPVEFGQPLFRIRAL